MLSYEMIKATPSKLLALTSLTAKEFEILLIYFHKAWDEYISMNYINRAERKRNYGAGRKPVLSNIGDKLFFILYYLKTYPLQTVIAVNFGISQSQANEWIHKLAKILRNALDKMGQLPERDAHSLMVALQDIAATEELAIDGTERRRQRPKDSEKQKEYYSGKKKPIL